ncbi:hypothetical protein OA959_03615 [SAR86 cluster bacterium]|nr:hypothetical protein [SAR86 cluster bacterium]
MKKSKSLFKQIILFVGFITFSCSMLFANEFEDECVQLTEELKRNHLSFELDEDISYQTDQGEFYWTGSGLDFGILFKLDFSESVKYLRNERNNIFVDDIWPGYFEDEDFQESNFKDKEVVRLNDELVSNLNDEEIFEVLELAWYEGSPLKLIFLEGKQELSLDVFGETYGPNGIATEIIVKEISQPSDAAKSTFEISYQEIIIWEQQGLDFISEKIVDTLDPREGFYCYFTEGKMKELNLYFPKINLVNSLSNDLQEEEFKFDAYLNDDDTVDGHWSKESTKSALIKSDFDYGAFPFDSQTVSLDFVSEDRWYDLVHATRYSDFLERSFENIEFDDWRKQSYSHSSFFYKGNFDQNFLGLKISFSLERNFGYYLSKVFLPILIILLVAFSVLWISPLQLESRLTVSVTCFLALIAFTYVADSDVPKLSYLTIMDNVILMSYFFAALPTFQSIFLYSFYQEDKESAMRINTVFKRFVPILYVVSIILIIFYISQTNPNTIGAMKLDFS